MFFRLLKSQRGSMVALLTVAGFFVMVLGVLVGTQIATQTYPLSYKSQAAQQCGSDSGAGFQPYELRDVCFGGWQEPSPGHYSLSGVVKLKDGRVPNQSQEDILVYIRALEGGQYLQEVSNDLAQVGTFRFSSGNAARSYSFSARLTLKQNWQDAQCPTIRVRVQAASNYILNNQEPQVEFTLHQGGTCPNEPTPSPTPAFTPTPSLTPIATQTPGTPTPVATPGLPDLSLTQIATPANMVAGNGYQIQIAYENAGEQTFNKTFKVQGTATHQSGQSSSFNASSSQDLGPGQQGFMPFGFMPSQAGRYELRFTVNPTCQPGLDESDCLNNQKVKTVNVAVGPTPSSAPVPSCSAPTSAPEARSAGPGSGAGDPNCSFSQACYGPGQSSCPPTGGSVTWGHFKVRRISEDLSSSQDDDGYYYRYSLKRGGQVLKTEDIKYRGGDPNLIFTNVDSSNFCDKNFDWSVSVQKVCADDSVSSEVESTPQNSWIGCCSGGSGGPSEPPICRDDSLCSGALPRITDFAVAQTGDNDGRVVFTWSQHQNPNPPFIEPAKYTIRWVKVADGGLDNPSSTECCFTNMCGGASDCGKREACSEGDTAGYSFSCSDGTCRAVRDGIVVRDGSGRCVQYQAELNYENKSGCSPHKQKSSNRITFSDCGAGTILPRRSDISGNVTIPLNVTVINQHATTNIKEVHFWDCGPVGVAGDACSYVYVRDPNGVFGPVAPGSQQSYEYTFTDWFDGENTHPILTGEEHEVGVDFLRDDGEAYLDGHCHKIAMAGSRTSITCTLEASGKIKTTQAAAELELADLVADGRINTLDYRKISDAYLQSGQGLPEDINQDGRVDALDMSILIRWIGYKVPAPAQDSGPARIETKSKPQ